MPLMKGSVIIKLRGRLLRVFPIWDWTLVAFTQIFINDLVSTLTFCAETGKMRELTGDLGYHEAEEEATEDWNKKKPDGFTTVQRHPVPCISSTSIIR